MEKMGIDFYFADPYCSWQRGCNENSNGLLRKFYPKKTDISMIDTEDLINISILQFMMSSMIYYFFAVTP